MEGIYVQGSEKSLWVSTESLISFTFTNDGNIVVEYYPDAKQQMPTKFVASQQISLFETTTKTPTFWINGMTLISRKNLRYIEQDTRITNFAYLTGSTIKFLPVQATPPEYLQEVLAEDQKKLLWPVEDSNLYENVN